MQNSRVDRLAAVVLTALLGACATAPTRTHFRADPKSEIPATIGMFVVGGLIEQEKYDWNGMRSCLGERRGPTDEELVAFEALPEDGDVCDETEILPIDRWVSQQNWELARPISDYGLITMLTLPFAFSTYDTLANAESAERIGVDAIVASQSISAALFAGTILKMAARRPRPYTYNKSFGKADRYRGDARLSFPSNHTSAAFAAASVTSVMVLERYGASTGSIAAVTGAYLGALTVGSMRVLGGRHFLTDVIVGAAIGTFFGLLVPIVHLDRAPSQLGDPPVATVADPRGYAPLLSFGGGW